MTDPHDIIFAHEGICDICECPVVFSATNVWYRDFLVCSECNSVPRERALMRVVKEFFPNFAELTIHETSPDLSKGPSARMVRECSQYSCSFFSPDVLPGEIDPNTGHRCEDVENLTFQDESLDLFISQDVFEHIFEPDAAFQQVRRVLKPGGAHIFTVPLVNKSNPTERCASLLEDGQIIHYKEPEYHGNPIDEEGSLVTMNWGYDIANFILATTGLPTMIIQIDDIDRGIKAEFIEVLVSLKSKAI